MKLSRVLLLGTSVLMSGMVPAVAFAQSTDAPPANGQAAAQSEQVPEDIVVTGDRNNQIGTDTVQSGSFRNAKVLDVPLTVSVIPSALLQSQQAIELFDAIRNTAGVSTTGTGTVAYQNVTIRGIAVDTRSNFKLDGTLNVLSATAFPLEDKDRVEVLKGASALYYGFSTPAGVINLVMKRPTQDLYFASNTFGDSNGGVGEHVDIGDTFGKFGFRVNGVAAHLDTGINYATGSRYLASGAFDFKPTDKLTITADVEYFQKTIVEPALFVLTVPATGKVNIPNVNLIDPKKNIGGTDWTPNKTHEFNFLVKGVYKFSKDWNLSAYYGQSNMVRFRNNPQFTLSAAQLNTSLNPSSPTYGAGTLRVSAQQATFQNIGYSLELAGTTHFGDGIRNEILLGGARSIRFVASSLNIRTNFAQNFNNPTYIVDPHLVYSALPPASKVDDRGLYLFDRLSLFHDVFQVLGGVRKSWYYDDGSVNTVTKTPYTANPISLSGGLVIKPVKWASAYATYIEGLESTPAAPINDDNALQVFPPSFSRQYEAGLKLQPRENLLAQFAYFKINRGAAYEATPPGATQPHYYVDGRQVYEGLEFSLSGYVVPDLAINATATKLTARYRDQPLLAGNAVDGAPDNTWSLFGEYRLSWLDKGLKLNAGVYHTGKQPINAANQAFTPSYTTFDVGGSYTFNIGERQLILRVTGQNVTNKRYWATVGGSALAENLPSTVKFTLGFKY